MRILHVINSLIAAGAERIVTDLSLGQARCGHTVEVLSLRRQDTAFVEQLRQAGVRVSFARRSEYSPLCVWALRSYLKRKREGDAFDVVHVHLWPAQYWAAAAKRMFGTSAVLVTTEHSTYNRRADYKLTSWTDRLCYGQYDGIACISPSTADFMRTRTSVPLIYIYNGVDVDAFASAQPYRRADLGVADNAFLLIQVARFEHQKNQDCVVRALQRCSNGVQMLFVGEGERMETVRRLAEELGVADRVRFLGVRADVPRLLATADAAVMSSHWEGFGLATVEAMAAGKPVLASDVEGLKQVVGDAEMLFPADDDAVLAQKILSLRDNFGQRQAAARRMQARAALFDTKKMVSGYLNFYADTIKRTE